MPKNNDLPQFFEELKLKEDAVLTLSDLVAQFKQQIPANFVYLEIKEKNYQCSTTGWKEPVCERYGFEYQGDWKQIDIPHPLMDKLGLKQKEDLPPTFYLAPHLLNKDQATTQGGITLQEGEIILVNPNKIIMKDQAIQTEPNNEKEGKIAELKKRLSEKEKQIQELETKLQQEALTGQEKEFLKGIEELFKMGVINNLDNLPPVWNKIKSTPRGQFSKLIGIVTSLAHRMQEVEREHNNFKNLQMSYNSLSSQITQKDNQINTLQTNYNNANNRANNLQTQLNTANAELAKEKDWWEKWINDSGDSSKIIDPKDRPFIYATEDWIHFPEVNIRILLNTKNLRRENIDYSECSDEGFLLFRIPIERKYYTKVIGRGNIVSKTSNSSSNAKQAMKEIYQYYRDK